MKMGHLSCSVTLVPTRVPHIARLGLYMYIISCRDAFVNRSCNIQGQLEVQLCGSKQKQGSRGRAPWWGSGDEVP